ncbi:MAG: LPS export ABC transporter ATP-binding protein [Salaquimonas sp.]|nr:LPS export ABC transporter ATP-binding protein [Salaquimonas sp.]
MAAGEEIPVKPTGAKRPKASLVRETGDFLRQILDDMAALPRDGAAFLRRNLPARAPRMPRLGKPINLGKLPRVSELPRMMDLRRVLARANVAAPAHIRPNGAGNGELKTAGRQGVMAAVGLQKSFKARQVVQGVTLGVRRGEAVGLLGPNGAGKTTCFYMITGLIKPDSGRIELDGHDITDTPMYRRARLGIGYLPQEASIFRGLSVENNIRAVLEIVEPSHRQRERQLDALLDEFSITHLRKLPSIALSGGERRRCEIARALATRPSFMLLDEPFAGIDPIAVGDIQQLVRHLTKRGIGVLITDHNVRETLGLIDRAYIIASGRVLTHGSPDEVVLNPDVRRTYLGEQFTL